VGRLADLKLIAPPGARTSYSQAGYNLAGRIVEKVTGLTYESAVASLVLEPLGLTRSFFAPDDVLLGDGRAEGGERVLPADLLRRMQEPTAPLRASSLGHAIGISWFLRDVDGVRTIRHAGSANGQFAELVIVPERDFAVVSLANADPGGIPCNQAVVRWALRTYLGLVERDPEPVAHDETLAREVAGSYENDAMTFTISRTDAPGLSLAVMIKPAIRFFTRDGSGAVVGVDLAGRLFRRVP
jgi:CubicO group peptidase (beta-lactamase class C family)